MWAKWVNEWAKRVNKRVDEQEAQYLHHLIDLGHSAPPPPSTITPIQHRQPPAATVSRQPPSSAVSRHRQPPVHFCDDWPVLNRPLISRSNARGLTKKFPSSLRVRMWEKKEESTAGYLRCDFFIVIVIVIIVYDVFWWLSLKNYDFRCSKIILDQTAVVHKMRILHCYPLNNCSWCHLITFGPKKQRFSSFEQKHGTDRRTDGRTDGRTRPLTEMRGRI